MPVGTYGTVKGVTPEEVLACGAEIVLAQHLPPDAAAGHRGRDRGARRPARLMALGRGRS